MSSRQFSLSVVASAILFSCPCTMAFASIDSTTEEPTHEVDLLEVAELFHYRQSPMVAAQLGMTALPAAPYADNILLNRGTRNGLAIQQDGIFLAPAPYSASTYIQPNLLHQKSVTSASMTSVNLGGQGSFGAINYQSMPISPNDMDAMVNVETSDEGDLIGGFIASGQSKQYGMLLGVDYQKASKDVGLTQSFDAEFSNTDILFKVDADSLAGARNPQRTEFSFQYTNKSNDNSLLGLTASDFEADAQKRYFATSKDNEQGKRFRYVLAHEVTLTDKSKVYTDFYYQSYEQRIDQMQLLDLESIDADSLQQLADFERAKTPGSSVTLGSIGQRNELDGFGVQTRGESMYGQHKVRYSARYHHDKAEYKFGYQDWIYGADLSFTPETEFSTFSIYTDDATALTSAVDTQLNYDDWYINIGLGYENVSVTRDAAKTDGLESADFSNDGWIPSIEFGYRQLEWHVALSVKQAWTAASAGNESQAAQEALQYELSAQYQTGALQLTASGYYHDFDNQHVTCVWGMYCDPLSFTRQENINNVVVTGFETALDYQLDFDSFSVPIVANYNYTKAEFDENGCIFFGCYSEGEQLAWVPEHQAAIATGVVVGPFSLMLNALYQSELGFQVSELENYSVDSQWLVDVVANYSFNDTHKVYLRVENALSQDLTAQITPMGGIAQSEMRTLLGYQGRF